MTARERQMAEYRAARQAQDARFEAANGSVSVKDTKSQEYADYFGVGDCRGAGVEERITLKRWLVENRGERAPEWITEAAAFRMFRPELEALADAGDPVAGGELDRRAAKRAARKVA